MSNVPDNPVNTSAGNEPDPLAKLYRMSRTAGLGSSDYRSVNVPAVTALILGVLSFAANAEIVLLVIPVTALVLGFIALYQIRNSGGTQTGLPMAVIGIVLALGFGAWAATGKYRERARTAADRQHLVSMLNQLGTLVRQDEIDQAYGELFSPTFKERVSAEKFTDAWRPMRASPSIGALKGLTSNGLFNFEVDTDTGLRIAQGQLIFEYEKLTPQDRPQIFFTYREGRWWIENIPAMFPLEGGTAPPG
jgi:hypothetical protein